MMCILSKVNTLIDAINQKLNLTVATFYLEGVLDMGTFKTPTIGTCAELLSTTSRKALLLLCPCTVHS